MERRAPSAPPAASEEPLRRLLAEHGAWLRRLVERRCPRHLGIDAAEIEQEVLVRVWRALERETELRSPASFLYRVVATTLVDAVRRRRARPEEPLMLQGHDTFGTVPEPETRTPSPEAATGHALLLRVVERELAALPERRRLAVRLHLQGFDTTEIGKLAGWSEPKARNLVYRGLGELRRRLHEQGIDYASD